jgi:hypothetical protein
MGSLLSTGNRAYYVFHLWGRLEYFVNKPNMTNDQLADQLFRGSPFTDGGCRFSDGSSAEG